MIKSELIYVIFIIQIFKFYNKITKRFILHELAVVLDCNT
jgi:hypothetical protein